MAIYYGDGSNSSAGGSAGRVIQSAFDDGSSGVYNFSNSNWTEIDNSFRVSFTPKEVGNRLVVHIVGNIRVNSGNLFSLTPVMHTPTGGNISMFAEQDDSGSATDRSGILGSQAMGESYRHSTSYVFWNTSIWAHFTVANIETHTLKLYGKNTGQLGDNTPRYMMMMTEHVA